MREEREAARKTWKGPERTREWYMDVLAIEPKGLAARTG
jgi:hypothetical protein